MNRLNKRIDSSRIAYKENGEVKRKKKPSMPPRNQQEANLILDRLWAKNPLLSLTASMSALTGLRYSDAAWLRFDDFYDEHGDFKTHFDLCQQKIFRMKMGRGASSESDAFRKSMVRVYTNESIEEIVEECRSYSQSDEYLFANARSRVVTEEGVIHRPMSVESADWHHANVARELNLKYTLGTHSWRKYFSSMLIQQGATVEKIRDLLGQKSLQSTNHYLHSEDDALAALISKIQINR